MITATDLQGHWQRDWIRAPGFEDHTTQVHWLQAGALYADIRVPLHRPSAPQGSLSDAPPEALRILMASEAFAGTITVEDAVCTWARDVNWHGQPDGVDAGAMHFEDDALIETGVHADYAERWVQKGGRLTARRVHSAQHSGVLVEDAQRFLLVMGVEGAPSTAPLQAALQRGDIPSELAAHFAQPCALGHWEGGLGIADLALNPFVECTPVVLRDGATLTVQWIGFDGDLTLSPLTVSPEI